MESPAKLPKYDWDDATVADNYARFRPTYAPLATSWVRDFYRAVSGQERAAIAIDAGCGPGEMSVPLAAFCDRVLAVDIADEMLAEARLLSARPNIEFVHGDVRALRDVYAATAAPPAGLLVSGLAAHYLDFDCDDFYDAVRSVVRPGGVIAHVGYHHSGFNSPGMENLLDDFFQRVVIADHKENHRKLMDSYRSLYFPVPEEEYRCEEMTVDMTREDIRNLLISLKPVFKDADRNIEEFMSKELPPGNHFGMKLKVFGRMAVLR